MDEFSYCKMLRELRGDTSPEETAEKLGIDCSTYCLYESGKRRPSDEKKKRIADYYHRSVKDIFF